MKEKLLKSLLIILLMFITILTNKVSAADSEYNCDLIITGENSEITAGQTVTYEIMAKNINAEQGILAFETLITYDENLFSIDVVSDDSNNWNKTSMIENYLTMTRSDLLPSSADQVIAKLVVTANSDVPVGENVITLTNIRFTMESETEGSFEIEDKSITLKIVEENDKKTDNDENENDNEKEPNNNEDAYNEDNKETNDDIINKDEENLDEQNIKTSSDNEQKNYIGGIITQSTASDKILPYTGIIKTFSIIFIVVLLLLSYIYYRKYTNWKKI